MPAPSRMRERGRAKKGTMKRLVKSVLSLYKKRFILVALCLMFNAFTNLCSSIFTGLVTGVLTKSLEEGTNPFTGAHTASVMGGSITVTSNVTVLLIIMGVIYGVGVFTAWWWNRTMAITTQEYLNIFRKKLFNHMEDLPISYFDSTPHGDIMSVYTNDIDTIRQFISQTLPELFRSAFTILICFTVMLLNSIWMTLVVIFCAIMMALNTKIIGGRASKYFIKAQRQVGVVEGKIEENIKGLKVIKVFTHEEKSCEDFDKANNLLGQYSTEANIHGNITMPINGNIGNIMYVLVAVMGVLIYVVPFKNLTLTGLHDIQTETFYATITSFLMMTRMFTNNISVLSQQVTFIVMGMAGASRCYDLMDQEKEMDEGYVELVHCKYDEAGNIIETKEKTPFFAWKHPHGDGSVTYTKLEGDIRLENVTFSYVPNKVILRDVSLYAKPGQKIAFVGATGAGKTTITNLLNRYYEIQEGKIRYDGINIQKIKKKDLRKSLGIVLQEVNLFSGTVMENIRYGRLEATDEEVYEAAKIANAYDFITRLPQGFNTEISASGANLSQGQMQLISIARAAIADVPVMILDEATSSIDTRTELLVQKGTDKLMEGRTVFVIAHRLSTVQNAKAIIVLDKGVVIERGTHDQLIEEKGTYYQLYTGAFELE